MSALPLGAPRPIGAHPLPDRSAPVVDPLELLAGGEQDDPRQGVLALAPAERPRRRRHLRPVPDTDDFGPRATPTDELPDAAAWAGRIGVTFLEVAAGARPAPQVMRHASPRVYESLVRRHSVAVRRRVATRRPVRLRRVVVSHPRDGVAEATVVVDDARRTRALALRLEGEDGRWVATALEIG